ncbi:site-2 protease family protein [Candidatus Woesearchaeota archaeon]|nr:site-2 protease family protein [Candidatus Woesearchaeota archaeon]
MLESLLAYKWIILFYLAVFLLVFLNRKRLEIHMGVFAMYKSRLGIGLMDAIALRFPRFVKSLGYTGIIFGFLGMAVVVGFIFYGLYALIFVPDAPAQISPVIPGVKIPGTSFFIPFWFGIIGIFLVAVVHEFGHGVVARAHRVPIKSTGPFVLGPFFGAFVEPDEKVLAKKRDIVKYSIFAAGPFFNFLLAALCFALVNFALAPALLSYYTPAGVSFDDFSPGSPAESSGLEQGVVYSSFNGVEVQDTNDLVRVLSALKPGDQLTVANAASSVTFALAENPASRSKPYMGVLGINNRFSEDGSFGFRAFMSLFELLQLVFILSLGIGTANLLPIGPIDGGRMVALPLSHFFGEELGKVIWARLSVVFLIFIFLLMTPIFRETFRMFFGA